MSKVTGFADCRSLERALWPVVTALHRSPAKLFLCVTGACTRLVSHLINHPGASAVICEVSVPYSHAALRTYLGDSHVEAPSVSREMALAMAEKAYQRGLTLVEEGERMSVVGFSATGALATLRARRGDDHVWFAVKTAVYTAVWHLNLDKGQERVLQEETASTAAVLTLARALGLSSVLPTFDPIDTPLSHTRPPTEQCDSPLIRPLQAAEPPASLKRLPILLPELVNLTVCPEIVDVQCGKASGALLRSDGSITTDTESLRAVELVYPGSFNPIHTGHVQLMEAAMKTGDVSPDVATYSLALGTFDKPSLEPECLWRRVAMITRVNSETSPNQVLVTTAPAFVQLAKVVPGAYIVCGIDTACRVLQKKYYNDCQKERDAALAQLHRTGTKLVVAGRASTSLSGDDTFYSVEDSEMLAGETPDWDAVGCKKHDLMLGIDENEFRVDLSSTELRTGGDRYFATRPWQ